MGLDGIRTSDKSAKKSQVSIPKKVVPKPKKIKTHIKLGK